MYDVPIISTGCRTPRSKAPRPSQTFPEENISSTTSKNTLYSPFEIKSESEVDEYEQMLSDNSFSTNLKEGQLGNISTTHSSSYTNSSISRPILIQEPVISSNARNFIQPPILAQSPKSSDFLKNDDDDFEFYPDEDEFYPTDSFMSKANNRGNSLFCFSEDDDDFDKRNGIEISKPIFLKEDPTVKKDKNSLSNSKNQNYIIHRSGVNLNNSFDEFDTKVKNSSDMSNNSIKLANNKFFNFEFDDSNEDNTNEKEKNSNSGLSTKLSQTRLLKFNTNNNQNNAPISFEPTNIDHLNETDSNTNIFEHEDDTTNVRKDIPRPFLPASVAPSHFLLEFQKHEAEENLRKARAEWDERIEKQKEISRNKFAELHEKQKMESAPFESRKSNKNGASPQRLELISKSSGLEQPVFRVRTVPSVNITKAISDYDKFSKANDINNIPNNIECNDGYDFSNGYDSKNGPVFGPSQINYPNMDQKPKSAIPPSTNSISSPRTIQTPRPMPKTPNPSKDPKRRTIFKATPEIPGMTSIKKLPNATSNVPLIPSASDNPKNNYSFLSMMSNEDMKREKKLLEDRHKQEVLALNAECSASIKALEDKKAADIAMKENQLKSIIDKIELQKKKEEMKNEFDFDYIMKNKNSATPDNFKQGRIDFNVTGRLNRKQQTIEEFQKQMMPYGDKD